MSSGFKPVKTSDGSVTLHSDIYGEPYHSLNGALDEALNKFVNPCRIKELAETGSVNLLDIGFGLGYNVLTAIQVAREANPRCTINIASLENDLLPVETLAAPPLPERLADHRKIITHAAGSLVYDSDNITLRIMTGDARRSIKEIDDTFDAVFLDPFSPKNNVELWTVDFFSEIHRVMTDTAILATYSAATPVRCGLMAAGFTIGHGPGDEMKKGGTLATKRAEIEQFSKSIQLKLQTSTAKVPYRDPNFSFTQNDIINYRDKELLLT